MSNQSGDSFALDEHATELRRWGLKLVGGKRCNKRAVVAVARKLAVILHRMWQTENSWQPFPQSISERNPSTLLPSGKYS